MGHEIDLSKYQIRTDLAIDFLENRTIEGIESTEETKDGIKITEVHVTEVGSTKIKKKPGNYVTIEFEDVTDYHNREKVQKVFGETLKQLLDKTGIKTDDTCLVIGLGNEQSTPDALGPFTIKHILVTNHLFLCGGLEQGFRRVSAMSPGVMGQTGIETSEIIKSIIDSTKPNFVLVIDALASQSVERLNKTIQMTDTGIHPGSGVGNTRKEISKETLGIAVIAVGVPTVVDAVSIVSDTIGYMLKHLSYNKQNLHNPKHKLIVGGVNYLKKDVVINPDDRHQFLGMLGSLEEEEVKQLIFEVLTPIGYNLIVAPKEVDFLMKHLSEVIGNGINTAIHDKVDWKSYFS